RSAPQGLGEKIRCRDRILNRDIDADASDRRHGVCRITDAQQSQTAPLPQPVHGDCQQLDLIPIAQLGNAARQLPRNPVERTVEWRPSAATTKRARTCMAPVSVFALTPTTTPSPTSRSVTSAFISRRKLG